MTKPSIPHISKKTIFIISLSFGILFTIGIIFFLLVNFGILKFGEDITNQQDDTQDKFNVYGDTVSAIDTTGEIVNDDLQLIEMTETCTSGENTYKLGSTAVQANNHCILSFNDATAFLDYDDYLNIYIDLPDGSLVVLNTKDSPSIQVDIYDNEIRVIQTNGYAYYRISEKDSSHRFVTQVSDILIQVTGTEYYVKAAEDENSILWGSIQLLEGSANLVDSTGKFIYDMLVPEDYDYGVVNGFRWTDSGMWERDQFSYNKGLLYTFTSENGISQESDPKSAMVSAPDEPQNFLSSQVMWTLKKYGFGNFTTNIMGNIEPMVSEQIETEKELRRDSLASNYAQQQEAWDAYNAAQESEEEEDSSSSSSSSGSSSNTSDDCVTSGASYQLCTMSVSLGSAHMEGSKCCFDTSIDEPTMESVY